jgi:class 3 adenylate cyclase
MVAARSGGRLYENNGMETLVKISIKSDTESCTDGVGRYSPPPESGRDDSPELLVRHETKVIRYLRSFAVLILVSASLIMAGSIFAFIRQSQQDNLEAEFAFIAESITDGLLEDSARYVHFGEAMVAALETTMTVTEQDHATFSIPSHLYSNMARPAIVGTRSRYLSWNPLLRSDAERHTFEAMVTKREEEGFFNVSDKPRCYLCGSEDAKPTKPDVQVLTGAGMIRCADLDTSGRLGLIPVEVCSAVVEDHFEVCGCAESISGTEPRDKRKPSDGIFRDGAGENYTTVDEPWTGGPYLPMWQDRFAFEIGEPLLYDHLSHPKLASAVSKMVGTGAWEVSEFIDESDNTFFRSDPLNKVAGPISLWYFPVRNSNASDIIGAVSIYVNWNTFAIRKVPRNGHEVDVVVEATCGDRKTAHTYNVDPAGTLWAWVGAGNLHDPAHGRLQHQTSFEDFALIRRGSTNTIKDPNSCGFLFYVYSTKALHSRYITSEPWLYAGSVIVIFIFTSGVFGVYDRMVRRRQIKIMKSATQTDDLVASLFPRNVRGRLFQRDQDIPDPLMTDGRMSISSRRPLFGGSSPIADLFPSCTVIFIDIAHFTPWCSEREPSQVFALLETLYSAFDVIATRVGVFKVETIGDSYVAVAGLPTPREDHASVMATFGRLCLLKMQELVKELEVTLGPSTGDLTARCGLHSGPVTAGVLRGTKARFQLFGDTVNTASRLQSTGAPNHLHASQQTATLLTNSGKSSWVAPRADRVRLKGKGCLQTYWLNPQLEDYDSIIGFRLFASGDVSSDDISDSLEESEQRRERLIKWNVQTLHGLLETLSRYRSVIKSGPARTAGSFNRSIATANGSKSLDGEESIVIDEMTEIIVLPPFDPQIHIVDLISAPGLPSVVRDQLHVYVSDIASLYRDVPFHNFEHASHVIMSATKLMSRIVSPEGVDQLSYKGKDKRQHKVAVAWQIHEMTYGLSSDALMQFSVVFSALIHDVDHTGLTNQELVSANATVADKYRNKCVAEQNSVDIAWDLLMQDRFADLRAAICPNDEELKRFRELIVDAVMATDIADKELGTLRKNRWNDAFSRCEVSSSDRLSELSDVVDMDRKATIVFEHIIQASDVAHTMQHWHTYQKYNVRLFEERYVAFLRGVAGDKPPWSGWYKGELWFFDNYIIPLAQKLHDCGVFGVSYDEYLNYAQENRSEWERKGEEIVQEWQAKMEKKYEKICVNGGIV